MGIDSDVKNHARRPMPKIEPQARHAAIDGRDRHICVTALLQTLWTFFYHCQISAERRREFTTDNAQKGGILVKKNVHYLLNILEKN